MTKLSIIYLFLFGSCNFRIYRLDLMGDLRRLGKLRERDLNPPFLLGGDLEILLKFGRPRGAPLALPPANLGEGDLDSLEVLDPPRPRKRRPPFCKDKGGGPLLPPTPRLGGLIDTELNFLLRIGGENDRDLDLSGSLRGGGDLRLLGEDLDLEFLEPSEGLPRLLGGVREYLTDERTLPLRGEFPLPSGARPRPFLKGGRGDLLLESRDLEFARGRPRPGGKRPLESGRPGEGLLDSESANRPRRPPIGALRLPNGDKERESSRPLPRGSFLCLSIGLGERKPPRLIASIGLGETDLDDSGDLEPARIVLYSFLTLINGANGEGDLLNRLLENLLGERPALP